MTGSLPIIVTLLILITGGLLVVEADGRGPRDVKRILPIGFFGRWGEGLVEEDVWFAKGSNAVLLCRISRLQMILDGQSGANITWLKDDLPIDNKRSFVTSEGHLNITKVQLVRRRPRSAPENDEGVYRCLLVLRRDDVEYMVSAPPIALHVAELSRHVTVSANATAIRGTAIRLTCKAPSQPPALLHWQKNELDLPQDDKISQPTSGVLQITNLEDSDGGIYRCVAYNELLNKTKYSENVSVVVVSPPPSLPPSSSSSLASSTSHYIPPSLLYPTSNETLRIVEGWRAIMECTASGLPIPIITWHRKGFMAKEKDEWQLLEEVEGKRSLFGAGNLITDFVSVEDAGRYLCTASSIDPQTGKTVFVSQEYKLVVIVEPRIANSPRNVTMLMAKTVRLNCSLQDPSLGLLPPGVSSHYFPAPHIVWYKNGVPVQLDTRTEVRADNQLVFLNSGTYDTAVYQCLVTNEAGYATAWSYLLVNSSNDHPLPPKDLQVVLLSPTSVLLTWSVQNVETNAPVVGYSIHLTEHGPKPFELQVVSQVPSHIFEILKPNTYYSYHVRAYSNLASDPSETVNFTTREAVPIAAPEFSLDALSPSTLRVTWSPLPAEKARGTVEGYKIQWQMRKNDYYHLNEVGFNTFHHEIHGLHPGKTYKVRVLARTKAGYNEGIDWPWKSITMPEVTGSNNSLKPMAPLMEVQLSESTGKDTPVRIEVSWKKQTNDNAPLTGYSLTYQKRDEPWVEPIILPATANSYVISDIEPTWYKIKLFGFNDHGEGVRTIGIFSEPSPTNKTLTGIVTTPPPNPTPTIKNLYIVPKVELVHENKTAIRLSWETSEVENKKVIFYKIKLERIHNNGSSHVFYETSFNNSIVIDDLTPFTTYKFAVRAHTAEDDHGPYSQAIQTNTGINTLTPPSEVSLEAKDESTVEVQWKGAEGEPNKYEVIYTHDKSLPVIEWKGTEVDGNFLSAIIGGLFPNTEYFFQVRSCINDECSSYTDPYTLVIYPAALSDTSDSSTIYLVAGLAVSAIVLVLVVLLTIYLFKYRMTNPRPIITSNANGNVGNHIDGGRGHHHHPGGRNGVSDLNGREGDYIPMLSRIHTDLPPTPMDTKGGYNDSRINGFANPKCNGVVRGKELHCGSNPHSKRDDSEERECLFPSSRDVDIMSRAHTEEGSAAEEENALDLSHSSSTRGKSPLPPLTQTYNDKEGVNCP